MGAKDQSGWVCPNCGKVYSPKVEECKGCNEGVQKSIPCVPLSPSPVAPWPWPEPWQIRTLTL